MVPYKLVRSDRKTLGIYILDGGKVEVRAPRHAPIGYINKFVKKKEEWIAEKQHALTKTKRTVALDTQIFIFGIPYIIKPGIPKIENGVIYVRPSLVREDSENLMRELARRIITERTKQISADSGIVPKCVKISRAKTRWGSCSADGSININWRLIMGDAELADYVIVHELCHIKQHNHSKEFWKEVEQLLPEYKKSVQKLKVLQKRLSDEGWF